MENAELGELDITSILKIFVLCRKIKALEETKQHYIQILSEHGKNKSDDIITTIAKKLVVVGEGVPSKEKQVEEEGKIATKLANKINKTIPFQLERCYEELKKEINKHGNEILKFAQIFKNRL